MAAESDIANRNLGVNARQVEKVKQAEAVRKGEVPPPRKPARTDTPTNASEIRVEKFEVIGSQIEELSGPDKTALQKFGDRLEADRKLTPAQMTQMVLSFFLGGPPLEKEPPIEERTQARVARGGTMLANPRGTLQ
jgi:hypothetical protein